MPCAVGTLPQVSSETGPARVDRDVAFERQWLDDGTWVDMARGWIADAPEAYDTLAHAVPWAPRRLWRYERWIEEPRVSHGYRAGQPVPHPVLLETQRAIQAKYRVTFDGFSLIWYRDGDDCQAFHRDRDMRFTEDTLVVILTLGARRPWLLRRRDRRDKWIAAHGGAEYDLSPRVATCSCSAGTRSAIGSTPCPRWRARAARAGPDLRPVAVDVGKGASRTRRLVRGAAQLLAAVTVMVDPLRNPVWHALGGPQAVFAEAKGRARRFHPDVSVFGALPDTPDADDWDALRALVGAGESAFLIRESIAAPDDWIATFELPCVQMVLEDEITPGPVPEHVALGAEDVPEMTDLVTRTEPGPWRPRTIEFGGYVGVHDRGALVAMAGERMRPPGFTEVSAVCTEPEYPGAVSPAASPASWRPAIAARGYRPMLHAFRAQRGRGATVRVARLPADPPDGRDGVPRARVATSTRRSRRRGGW